MEIRLLYENELQAAVDIAHETFEICVRPYGRTQDEVEQYYKYVNVGHLWQEMRNGQIALWGVFENGQMCAVSAMQSTGHITMLYVEPHCQRRKMGAQLVNHMCAYAAQILHKERVTIDVTPVSIAPFFYHIGFVLVQGIPLDSTRVPLERRIWGVPQGQPMPGTGYPNTMGAMKGYGTPMGAPNIYGNPAGTVYKEKRPEVTYPTKKVSNKLVVALVAGTLILSTAIMTGVTIHHMVTDGVQVERENQEKQGGDRELNWNIPDDWNAQEV